MARLCKLNPEINYKPVQRAVDEMNNEPKKGSSIWWDRVTRSSIEFYETTVTAYEMLTDDVKSLLVLMEITVEWHMMAHCWRLMFKHNGHDYDVFFPGGYPNRWHDFIGYILDYGHPPTTGWLRSKDGREDQDGFD